MGDPVREAWVYGSVSQDHVSVGQGVSPWEEIDRAYSDDEFIPSLSALKWFLQEVLSSFTVDKVRNKGEESRLLDSIAKFISPHLIEGQEDAGLAWQAFLDLEDNYSAIFGVEKILLNSGLNVSIAEPHRVDSEPLVDSYVAKANATERMQVLLSGLRSDPNYSREKIPESLYGALEVYAEAGPMYQADAVAMLGIILTDAKDKATVKERMIDWMYLESRDAPHEYSKDYDPIQRWEKFIRNESPAEKSSRVAALSIWNSQGRNWLRSLHRSPRKIGGRPKPVGLRAQALSKEIVKQWQKVNADHGWEEPKGFLKLCDRLGSRIADMEAEASVVLQIGDLAALVEELVYENQGILLYKNGISNQVWTQNVDRMSHGGFRTLLDRIQEELAGIPEVGDINMDLALRALKTKDPQVTVRVLLERWKLAYSLALEKLKDIPEAGEIALSIASHTMSAAAPEHYVLMCLERWKLAYDLALEELKSIPEAGEIAKSTANLAMFASDPQTQVQIYLERWKLAYEVAVEGLKDIPEVGAISGTLANLAMFASDPQAQVQIYLKRWKLAYELALEGLQDLPEAGAISVTLADKAMLASAPQVQVQIYLKRWKLAYSVALEKLQDIPEVGEIAVSIANRAMLASDPQTHTVELLERWKLAYSVALEKLKDIPEAGEIAVSIAGKAMIATDPKSYVLKCLERWKLAYSIALEKLKDIHSL